MWRDSTIVRTATDTDTDAWEVGDCRFVSRSGIQVLKKSFRILCLEGSVILFVSLYPQEVLVAQFSIISMRTEVA